MLPVNHPRRIKPVHARHADVHQNYIREQFSGQFHRILTVAGLADNLKIGLLTQQACQALTHDGMIVGEQYPDLAIRFDQAVYFGLVDLHRLCVGNRLKRLPDGEGDCQSETGPLSRGAVDLKPPP